MNRGAVCRPGDQPVEGIDLADQMALAQAPDCRIAAHRAHGIEIETDQRHPRTHPRSNRSRLTTRMAAADNDDVEGVHGVGL